MEPLSFVAELRRERATAILRTPLAAAVEPAMRAAVEGGFRILEFTLTCPGALGAIRRFSGESGLSVGAGTVLQVDDARRAVDAGARFLVSPVVDEAVIEEAVRLGVAVVPGAHTPTELLRAQRAGAPLQKLFPAPAGGPAWLRAVLAPLPSLRVVPTHGVDATNAAAWLEAGAVAVGFVAPLFDAEALSAGRFDRVTARARELLAAVRGARLQEVGG